MECWIGLDAEGFTERAEVFLASRLEYNLLATVLDGVHVGPYRDAVFAVLSDERGETVGAALRTPPHRLLAVGRFEDPGLFMARWLGRDSDVPGVSAEPRLADALARAWAEATGGQVEGHLSEALHVLTRVVVPVRVVPGALRVADWRERAQLGEWGGAFAAEAGISDVEGARAGIEYQIAQRRLYVWASGGQNATMIGHTATVAGTVRVGPVYTPVELRGRGYATAATAALSRLLLDAGAARCMLYTDLANAVSNHVYAKVGYVRVGDWEELDFQRDTGRVS